MFKAIFTIVLLAAAQASLAQKTFTVSDFSKTYFARVKIEQCDTSGYCSGPGTITILSRQSAKPLISVSSDNLSLWLHNGKVRSNIKELPYGEQSVIIYDDFNFDGQKDLAIQDGQNSCYGGPSFEIYLAQHNTFKYNEDFTRLAQEYCGMFQVNAEEKKLSTMTKDGCCWHQFSEFIVENNKPKAVHIVEEDHMRSPYDITTEKVWKNGKMVTTTTTRLELGQEGFLQFLSFRLEKSGKTAALFSMNGKTLTYVLFRKDDEVEFIYPADDDQQGDFTFDDAQQTVTFSNKGAQYVIYDNPEGKTGITVTANGKQYEMPGISSSKEGSLQELKKVKLDNIKSIN